MLKCDGFSIRCIRPLTLRARETNTKDFLSCPDTNFIIPVYQRNYDWRQAQCEDFVQDIERLINRERKSHFFGTIVYIKNDDPISNDHDIKEFIVIDGQQRITTIMLFLKAIYDVSDDIDEKEAIKEDFLTIKRNNKLKLKPIKKDDIVFQKLLNHEVLDKHEDSRIYHNYQFFIRYIKNSPFQVKRYFYALRKLWVVAIELQREQDDPQLIFESINSTGVSLSQADLIRNFILMDKKYDEQKHLFETYWSNIEKYLLNENISAYVRDYLTMKDNQIPNQKEVYSQFKQFVYSRELSAEALLKDLLYHAKHYGQFLFLNASNPAINRLLQEIQDLKVTVSYPFLLQLFQDYQEQLIDDHTLIDCLRLIRDYIFRRLVCGYSSNGLNQVFMALYKEMKAMMVQYQQTYYDCLAARLLQKRNNAIYPDDQEFKYYFLARKMYQFSHKKYLLYQLESYQNKEVVPLEDLTVEHIMPQKLTSQWYADLGDKADQIHGQLLHTIGNLTLTGYNANLSNNGFKEKKHFLFDHSGVKLNKYFKNIEYWTQEAIETRGHYLFDHIAVKVWRYPNIHESLISETIDKSYYDLNDNVEVTGKELRKIEIQNDVFFVKSWKNGFMAFCNALYHIDPSCFRSLINDNDFHGRKLSIISDCLDNQRKPESINDNVSIYVETNLNANSIFNYMKMIAEKYKFKGSDIVFYFD